jgi:magnesium transporter
MRSIFVLDDDEELIGCVPSRNLVINPSHLPLKQVMRPVLHKVRPEASCEEVVELVERYKVPTLPVVGEDDTLLGVISYEDVVEVMEDIQAGTIASIGGTIEDVSEYEPIAKRFFYRAPWLIVTLFAGLVTATGLAYFQKSPWYAIVPFFVPLITGMSGNVGIQCSTIFVRGIATGEVSRGSKREMVLRELSIGATIGVVFGVLCGVVVYLLNKTGVHHIGDNPFIVGMTVSAGVFGACMTATCLGTLSPLFFTRIGIDPAVASGPIVTAFNDVSATFMYFLVAKVVFSLFS